ncbi:MAG: hypothetical protein ACPGR5_03100 [Chitinophagales bacterium]
MKKLTFAFFSFILFSCEEMPVKEISIIESSTQIEDTTKDEISKKQEQIIIQKTIPQQKEFRCNFGDIEISIKQEEDEVFIKSNFDNLETFKHKIKGKIVSFFETDVNADGFNEFYCITSNGDLVAYSSYRNKSFGEIYVPQMPNHFYKEIRDLESWEVKNNKLHLTFSNTVDEVLNTVRYKLINGETAYKLEAS